VSINKEERRGKRIECSRTRFQKSTDMHSAR
jgi:hypothetical protein